MLRLHLAEKWEPKDYLSAISAVETIYYVALLNAPPFREISSAYFDKRSARYRPRDGSIEGIAVAIVEEARLFSDGHDRLIVHQIKHASPGFMDFEGVGQVATAMDSAFGRIIDVFTNRRMRRERDERSSVETEIARENLNSIKIENARMLLELGRDYPEIARQRDLLEILVGQQSKIEDLAGRGLITDQRRHEDDE